MNKTWLISQQVTTGHIGFGPVYVTEFFILSAQFFHEVGSLDF